MGTISVVVCGAQGRMGREVVNAVLKDPELELVGGADPRAMEDHLPGPRGPIPLARDLPSLLSRCRPDVMVDFTQPEAAMGNVRTAMAAGARPVVGTTGLTQANLAEIAELCRQHNLGAVVAPNFALGAVLMIRFAQLAAPYFEYAEIIELHHEQKADAPSGTAVATAQAMVAARGRDFAHAPTLKETLPHARGATLGGVALHSVRLPGLVAHQEVILGGLGQTLTLRHDSVSRESFLPGVILAVKRVPQLSGLVYGLEGLLQLG